MRSFSIKELERFSDIKAHTIRTWEKRYHIFNPQRTGSNIRHYSLEDVYLLLKLSLLNEYGIKISVISGLSNDELMLRIASLRSDTARQRFTVNKLIYNMFNNDTDEFETVLDDALLIWGIDTAIQNVIMPFLEKVQVLSYKDSSIEVHFIVTAIRRKLILGIEHTLFSRKGTQTALLFLPKGEHYDLMLLYMNYILKQNGLKVLYLGTNISLENLESIYKEKVPDYLFTYITSKNHFPLQEYIGVVKNVPAVQLLIAYAHTDNKMNIAPGISNIQFFNYKHIAHATNLANSNIFRDTPA